MHRPRFDGSFEGWRSEARRLLQAGIAPHQVDWMPDGQPRHMISTVLDGLRAHAPAGWTVTHARGADILTIEADPEGETFPDGQPRPKVVHPAAPDAALVFLLPPSWDELVQRLVGRGTEDAEERARRLRTARVELAAQGEFDYRVVNAEVAEAAREVVELTKASARPS